MHSTDEKSSRHSKIIGDTGELLICNWLSRYGFEVAVVDHTGIDIVAYHSKSGRRLGITVKSRARNAPNSKGQIHIFHKTEGDDRLKVEEACKAFACDPWIGIYVESEIDAHIYLTSLVNYDKKYKRENVWQSWHMDDKSQDEYVKDTKVRHIHMKIDKKWDWSSLEK